MKIFSQNPITKRLHEDWLARIERQFPSWIIPGREPLSIIQYLEEAPQRFYNPQTLESYLHFLTSALKNNASLLAQLLIESEAEVNHSNRILKEINQRPIHDCLLPNDSNKLLDFIDKEINYNLLRLYEGPMYQFSLLLAKYERIKAGKGTDKMDLFNVMDDLKKGSFSFLSQLYKHNIRNGIAHGKVFYSESDITYKDKKNNTVSITTWNLIQTFDNVLDVCNSMCLAYKLFVAGHPHYLAQFQIPIPQSILLEELIAKVNAPGWEVSNYFNMNFSDRKQINIHVSNKQFNYNHVLIYCFITSYWAERLTLSIDRVFISLKSYNSKAKYGWAAFNANWLKELRNRENKSMQDYAPALEGGFVFFVERFKILKLFTRLITIITITKLNFSIERRLFLEKNFPQHFQVRQAKVHNKNWCLIIEDASVVMYVPSGASAEQLIRNHKKMIVKRVIRFSRKQFPRFSLKRYLPVGYVRLFIRDTDARVRTHRHGGLSEDLIASIQINKANFSVPDIINSIIEHNGKYRIAWYKNWKDRNKEKSNSSI